VRASELSEALSHTLSQTLIRWIVDLNFGVDVAAPMLTREFRIEESPLTMPDVSLLIQSGYTPRKEWIERHFRVELEEKQEESAEGQPTTYDPQSDQDLVGSIFGGGQPTPEQQQAAAQDLDAAANVMDMPAGAAPEETQTETMSNPSAQEQLGGEIEGATPEAEDDYDTLTDDEDLMGLLAPDEEEEGGKKPFGNQIITEDEAVEMDRK
jgi:hypothetical protein